VGVGLMWTWNFFFQWSRIDAIRDAIKLDPRNYKTRSLILPADDVLSTYAVVSNNTFTLFVPRQKNRIGVHSLMNKSCRQWLQ
jgi:hypothetical protein